MALLQPLNPSKPRPLAKPKPSRPSLRLLPQLRPIPSQPAKPVTFAVILSSILVLGSLVLLLINTLLAQDAFVLHRLQQHVATLTAQEQAVTAITDRESSPDSLATKATLLGMVAGETPVFLDLNTGKVVGAPGKTTKNLLATR